MENASKALLIAGAILIVILLIGVGMMVFRGANDSITGAMDTMNSQEITAFNSQFSSYEGQIKGTSVKDLLQKVIASNAGNTYNRTVKVSFSGVKDSKNTAVTLSGKSDGNSISTAASKLVSTHTYTVSFKYDTGTNDGCINEVTVTQ